MMYSVGMFFECKELVGNGKAYDSNATDKTWAQYTTGYLTKSTK